ncbi:MAG TPA: hypothetical protein VF600_12005 [Abditibacteriaceae bacterium]|jgi:stalled ribosome alternative rescue factor ArfA
MSLSGIAALVEKFPSLSPREHEQLLQWVRTTPLVYGAWRPFKRLFKKVETATLEGSVDAALLGAFLLRMDSASATQASTRWKPTQETTFTGKTLSTTGGGFTYTVGPRQQWDGRGWRLVVTPQKGAPGQAFDFELREYVYHEVKKVELKDGLLQVTCGPAYAYNHRPNTVYQVDVSDPTFIHLPDHGPKNATLGYMKRRARRLLRHLSTHKGELYLQIVLQLLRREDVGASAAPVSSVTQAAPEQTEQSAPSRNPFHQLTQALLGGGAGAADNPQQGTQNPIQSLIQALGNLNISVMAHDLPTSTTSEPAATSANVASNEVAGKTQNNIDPKIHWITMDVLFGAGPRWEQKSHGRGSYARKPAFVLKRREERAPHVWDAHLDVVRQLFASRDVALEANEMALRILRAHGETIEAVNAEQAQRFWRSELPLLQSLAARDLTTRWENGESLDGATWAQLVTRGNARVRRALNTPQGMSTAAEWRGAAVKELEASLNTGRGTKVRRAAEALLRHFQERIGRNTITQHLATFLTLNEYSKSWVLQRLREWTHDDLGGTLFTLVSLTPQLRAEVLSALREEMASRTFSVETALPLVAGSEAARNALGWEVLAASAISREVARDLWRRVWATNSWFAADVLKTAAGSEAAHAVFVRADISGEEIETQLEKTPAFFAALIPAFLVDVFRVLSPATQVERALLADDEQWNAARNVLLQTLREARALGAFWNQVLQRVGDGGDEALQRRILDDDEISATLTQMPAESITPLLERADVAQESFVLRWLDANLSQLQKGDTAILAAATHSSLAIRERGLLRLSQTGIDLPLALRLMESALPQPFETGRAWFEMNTQHDVADLALALCDSPEAIVRAYGREFLQTRGEQVLNADILQKLGENSDPAMQAWLAERLLRDGQDVDTAAFDRAVLRTRGRARRAKEAVKTRRDVAHREAGSTSEYSDEDVKALLEVARGRTARDREWALQQLAQLALGGRKIEGVTTNAAIVNAVKGNTANGLGGGE